MDNHDAIIEIEEVLSPAVGSGTAGPVGANARLQDDQVTSCLNDIKGELEKGGTKSSFQAQASSCTIFRIPGVLRGINPEAENPELVSIGPYHRGQEALREFEEHKWLFLKSFLRRTDSNLERLFKLVADKASSALGCYSKPEITLNEDFVKMMLVDGCFVVELLLQICKIGGPHPIPQGIIRDCLNKSHILIRDLLKLENQIPYSLLQSLFEYSSSARIEARTPYLSMLALRVFNLAYSGATELPESKKYTDLQYQLYDVIKERPYVHLLDVIYSTFFLAKDLNKDVDNAPRFRPRDKAIPTVTQLKPCGIKFKPKKTERFLDISFRKRVLEIPSIAVNDFMVTVLINCIALEKCQESIALEQGRESSSKHKHITDYVSFMHCLINQPKDVSLLCLDGIITTLSRDDQYVVNLFNGLGKSIVFNVNNCYLSKQFEELDSYYYSNCAYMFRTYFSSPWAAIAAFSAFLTIALTATQTVLAVLGYYSR